VTELDIPADLEEIVLRCLAKEPGDRPASAWELRELLGRLRCFGAWTRDQARRWWETHAPEALDGSLP
jgi:serine/threonine-protein kinase